MASVFPRISIRRSIEDLAFSSCGRWRMDFMQNFTLNITVLVFAPGLLNQNIWRRKSASTRTSVRARQEILTWHRSYHSSERPAQSLMTERPRSWARRSTPPAKTFTIPDNRQSFTKSLPSESLMQPRMGSATLSDCAMPDYRHSVSMTTQRGKLVRPRWRRLRSRLQLEDGTTPCSDAISVKPNPLKRGLPKRRGDCVRQSNCSHLVLSAMK